MKKKKKKNKNGKSGKDNGWTTIDAVGGGPLAMEVGINLLKIREGEENMLVLFTKKMYPFSLHFQTYPDLRSYGPYVHCNGPEGSCILCRAGKPMVKKFITPLFSIEAGGIKLLPISPSLEPFALLPQLVNIFKNGGNRHLVLLRRDDRFKFSLSPMELEELMEVQITPVIKEFKALLKKGLIDIESAYPHVSNRVLAEVPEIQRILKAKGITLGADEIEEDEED
jgi:hypothetical protein